MEAKRTRIKQPAGILLSEIPGFGEVLAEAERNQFRTRENSLLGLTYNLCGFKVRTLSVKDYVLLDRIGSPFIRRLEPTMGDLALFLWLMSPQFALWAEDRGWRKHFSTLRPIAAWIYGRRIMRKFGRNCPESSEPLVVACFGYVDEMFFDSPPSVNGGGESCLSYLTGWFDALQSEYKFSNEQVWDMGLPELFQRLNAIRQRHNPSAPSFNRQTDELKMWVVSSLRKKDFTMEDLRAGKVVIPKFKQN